MMAPSLHPLRMGTQTGTATATPMALSTSPLSQSSPILRQPVVPLPEHQASAHVPWQLVQIACDPLSPDVAGGHMLLLTTPIYVWPNLPSHEHLLWLCSVTH